MEKTVRVVRDICGRRISLPTDLLTYSNFQVFKNSYYPLCEQPSEGVLKKGISLLDLHNYFFCWVLFCLISLSTMDCKKLKNVYLFKKQQSTWRSIFLLNLKNKKQIKFKWIPKATFNYCVDGDDIIVFGQNESTEKIEGKIEQ